MTKESATAMGSGSIDWALASKQHDGYVNALSKIVDSVEVRITVGTAGRFSSSCRVAVVAFAIPYCCGVVGWYRGGGGGVTVCLQLGITPLLRTKPNTDLSTAGHAFCKTCGKNDDVGICASYPMSMWGH